MAIFSLHLPAKEMSKSDMANYLFMMNEKLKYMFGNLDAEENFSKEMKEKYVKNDEEFAKLVSQAGKISWIVGSGTDKSNFTLTPDVINIISKEVNITGAVTFEDLKTEGKCNINAENINAGTISADMISGGTISGVNVNSAKINAGTLEGVTINANSINGVTITGGYITGDSLEIPVAEGSSLYVLKADKNSCTVGDFSFSNIMMSTGGRDFRVMYNGEMWGYRIYCGNPSAVLSDRRRKENIESIDRKKALEFIKRLRPVSFDVIDGEKGSVGFIAQEVEELTKDLGLDWRTYEVMENGYMSIAYSNYIAILTAAIQELRRRHGKIQPTV